MRSGFSSGPEAGRSWKGLRQTAIKLVQNVRKSPLCREVSAAIPMGPARAITMKRYHPVHLADLPPIACCCGTTRRAFVDLPDAPASAHLLEVKDEPTSHYHLKTTEIYVVLEGEGFLELDGEQVPVKPLSAVMIRPGCRHRAIGKMKILNIPVPKHDDADFYYDEGAAKPGETPVH
jgi:mannose-6-phosphate isomerase-like protein (cupin superfamily)